MCQSVAPPIMSSGFERLQTFKFKFDNVFRPLLQTPENINEVQCGLKVRG